MNLTMLSDRPRHEGRMECDPAIENVQRWEAEQRLGVMADGTGMLWSQTQEVVDEDFILTRGWKRGVRPGVIRDDWLSSCTHIPASQRLNLPTV
jgi:hypothetical protein